MSDFMPLTVNNEGHAAMAGDNAAAGTAAGSQPATGFSGILQSRMAATANSDGVLLLPLIDTAESGAAIAADMSEDGKLLPQQNPLQAWALFMAWNEGEDKALTHPLQAVSSLKSAASKPDTLHATLMRGENATSSVSSNASSLALDSLEQQLFQQILRTGQQHAEQGQLELLNQPKAEGLMALSSTPQPLLAGSVAFTQPAMHRADSVMTTMPVPPQHPNWDQALGERIQWMLGQHVHRAELRLDPPDLGMLEVRVMLNKDQANVSFTAPNAQVRDAVEMAAPRLREMFGDIGLSLGDVNVSQESFAEQRQAADNPSGQAAGANTMGADAEATDNGSQQNLIVKSSEGLLDIYA